jgi:CRISPR-associated protein Cas6
MSNYGCNFPNMTDRISEEQDCYHSCSEEFGDYLFPVEGQSIGVDHAHPLYGGISQIIPEFHDYNSIGIFGINGKLSGVYSKRLNIGAESVLRVRIPLDLSRSIYKLAGKTLHIHQDKIYLGIPELELIVPSQILEARIVTIKGFQDASTFETAAQDHLDRLEIVGKIQVLRKSGGQPKCRTVKIHQKKVVGFAVRVEGLSHRDSLILQHQGLGGRRKLGCGLFAP